MGLYKNDGSRIWWISYTVHGRQVRESTKTSNKRVAEKVLAKKVTEVAEGRWFPEKKKRGLTVKGLRDFWLEHAKGKKTLDDDEDRLDTMVEVLGADTPVAGLEVGDVDRLRNKLATRVTRTKRPMEPGTVNRHLTVLRSALRAASKAGYEHHIPSDSIKFLEEANERDRVCTPEEYKLIIDAADQRLRLAVVIAYHTAMRQGEIVGLEWKQVDLKARMFRLAAADTKTRKGRAVPMISEVYEALKAYPRRVDGKVFGVDPTLISSDFAKLVKRLEIVDLRFHDLRHTALTNLRRAGVDIFTMKRISGHKTLKMLERYNTITEDDLQAAMERLEQTKKKPAKKEGSTA
jgi:integrase